MNLKEELIKKALNQLKECRDSIRLWHGSGHSEEQEKTLWEIYNRQSPEMKRLNLVINELDEYLKTENKPQESIKTAEETLNRQIDDNKIKL